MYGVVITKRSVLFSGLYIYAVKLILYHFVLYMNNLTLSVLGRSSCHIGMARDTFGNSYAS